MSDALHILQNKSAYVFEGGSILGIGHAGALVKLYELGGLKKIDHVVGSSVGSIVSMALACGASSYYIKDKILKLDVSKFEDGGNWISRIYRFLFRYGIHKGYQIETYAGEILSELTGNSDITFLEAYNKYGVHLTITYLSVRHKKTKYADHITKPDMMIKTAVRWSSSIPLFFMSPKYYKDKELLDIISDGGVANNYPINILRNQGCSPESILGFKLYNDEELENEYNDLDDIDYGIPRNIKDYALRLVDILREQALRYHVHKDDWKLTCKINVAKYSTTDFDITEEDKLWLYNSGMKAMEEHLGEIEELLQKDEYPNM